MDSVRILLYTLIFLLSVFGNLLIIIVLMMNKRMRTVTNSFLLSLAVSDLMMAIFCMPFTLIPNILEDFIFGAAMCKTVSYFMGKEELLSFNFLLGCLRNEGLNVEWFLREGGNSGFRFMTFSVSKGQNIMRCQFSRKVQVKA